MADAERSPTSLTQTRAEVRSSLSGHRGTKPQSYLHQSWNRFRRNTVAIVALFVTVAVLLFGFGAPLISAFVTNRGFSDQDLLQRFKMPLEDGHVLGTDNLGRDVLTRLAYGGRVSMSVALGAVASALTIGIVLGALSGYYGRWIDSIIMRLVDIMLSIPVLFLLIFVGTLVTIQATTLAVVIASVSWMGLARLVRGEVMSLKGREYIEAAKLSGASDARVIFRHVIPNVVPIIIVWATLTVPVFIIVEATLSFLGLGVQVPTPSWGNMLNDAQRFLSQSWTLAFIPGMMIYITVLAINLLGNGLRDALDPRLGG